MNAPTERPAARQARNEQRKCERHRAEYTSWELARSEGGSTWSPCPECQKDLERQREWVSQSGLEGRFKRATFETFHASTERQQQVLASCREYIANLRRDEWRPLWLIGPPGTGKTHLGAAMVQATITTRLMRAEMHSARQLIRDIRSTWRKGSEDSEDDAIRWLAGVALLVIDELGVGSGSESELVQLLDVIDGRYQLERPTVLISNLNMPALQASLGDRIFDRLRENAMVLTCNWPSHRQGGRS